MASERETELLRQILAEPDDLVARTIYADELQRRGDPRGEFIALELAGDVTRARALFDRHAEVWWRQLAPRRIATRYGFVERVAGRMSELASAAWMFGHEPIRDIEVVDIPTHPVQQFDVTRVHPCRLALHGHGRDAVAKLIAAQTDSIATLDVSSSELDHRASWGRAFANCRVLSLAHNPLAGQGIPRLIGAWDAHGALEELDVSGTTLIADRLRDLLQLGFPKLRRLKLSNNAFGDAGARMLVEARLPALESLELIECGVEPPMIATLNDTFGCRLVHTTPDDVVLDLVGSVLEFHRAGSNSWAIAIDGTLRPVRWQAVARDHRPDQRVTSPWQTAELAPLDALVSAIAVGSTRQLTESGCRIDLGSDTRYVYDAAVHTSETAEISYELRGSTVTVTLDTYTTFD